MEEYIVQTAPKFENIEKSRTAYERAVNAVDVLPVFIDAYRGMLLDKMGLGDPYRVPEGAVKQNFGFGPLELQLEAHRTTSPSYKGIAEAWQGHINGINFLSQTRQVSGFPRENGRIYTSASRLLEDFFVGVYANLKPSLELNASVDDANIYVNEIILPTALKFDGESVRTYINALKMQKDSEAFVKEYKKALGKTAKTEGTDRVSVTKKTAYKIGESVFERVKWPEVVKTLVTMPTERNAEEGERELEMLADETLSLDEKKEELGEFYDLKNKKDGLYIGIDSVMTRIEDLKGNISEVESLRVGKRENLKPLK